MELSMTSTPTSPTFPFEEGRKLISKDEAIIDPVWKQQRKAEVGGTVMLFERPFKIVGVYEPPGGGRIKVPLSTLQERVGAESRFGNPCGCRCFKTG